jgi:hypothetical protein
MFALQDAAATLATLAELVAPNTVTDAIAITPKAPANMRRTFM